MTFDDPMPRGESESGVKGVTVAGAMAAGAAGAENAVIVPAENAGIVPAETRPKRLDRDFVEILSFGLPVLGGLIADPLMALVDTACCGQLGTAQLAALGPVGNIFLFLVQVFGFLGTATTNLVATNAVVDGDDEDTIKKKEKKTAQAISHGLILAATIGFVLSIGLVAFAKPLLRLSGANSEIMPYSLSYMKIRALGIPGIFLTAVAHGACLGRQDAWSPLIVYLVAGTLNLFGDLFLIFQCGMGVSGAALATTISTYAGVIGFMSMLRRSRVDREQGTSPLRWMGWPTVKNLKPFLRVGNALLFRNIAAMTAYSCMTVFATWSGTRALATHQISLQLFWFLSFFAEPLSICGQSMVARQSKNKARLQTLSNKLLKISVLVGLGVCFPLFFFHITHAHIFTSDPKVVQGLRKVLGFSMLAEILCATTVAFDGISIGSGDFSHLPLTNFIAVIATVATLGASHWFRLGVVGVWMAMCSFFLTRLVVHSLRAARHRSVHGNWPLTAQQASGRLDASAM